MVVLLPFAGIVDQTTHGTRLVPCISLCGNRPGQIRLAVAPNYLSTSW